MALFAGQVRPFSLVWVPIPIVTWLFPFIGHLGVTRSDGAAFDFAGHFTVNIDPSGRLAFGAPTKVLALQPERAAALLDQVNHSARSSSGASGGGKTLAGVWDDWLSFSRSIYSNRLYGFFTDNCHAFVAHFLNSVRYDGCKDWNPVQLAWRMQLGGSHIGSIGFIRTWGPFVAIFGAGVHWGGQLFLLGWAAAAGAVLAWFGLYGCLRSKNTSRILSI